MLSESRAAYGAFCVVSVPEGGADVGDRVAGEVPPDGSLDAVAPLGAPDRVAVALGSEVSVDVGEGEAPPGVMTG
ncbi:hypothetical protein [Streptomyces shenzhenensis]|uniref:hypothetical protein n=1 Tax=Streptomyces shenzhenensis TaxID=943815 RepID=UPI00340B8193